MRGILLSGTVTAFLLLVLLYLPACTVHPLIAVGNDAYPAFRDDLNRQDLWRAVENSLAYLRSRPQETTFSMAEQKNIPLSRLIRSLTVFQELLATEPTEQALQELIEQRFDVFQAAGQNGFNPDREMLVTGYYQPVFKGSMIKRSPYLHPLYSLPKDLVVRPADNRSQQQIGRLQEGRFLPYWSREEIDTLGKLAGNELVWLQDPLDVFFLHIQGSGLIQMEDGSVAGVHFAGKNGHPYRSIGRYMVKTGRMRSEDAGMETIRRYLESHPLELEQILFQNPSYIFFDWTSGRGAIGSLGQELTPGRSIAVDRQCFPAGGLAFLESRRPVIRSGRIVHWRPVRRFVLAQDSGSAIRGPGRVDLFWGTGDKAGRAAGTMKESGRLYFLLLRSDSQ